ncbi:MAG TPA: Ig-like domain repeat protein [Terracidiphilus sp.]|nr:Ig-like domain repeat protein [Terracidiphilus sp.]
MARFLRNTPWVLLCLVAVAVAQPAAHYSPSSVNIGGGFNAPNGTAVNGSGNLSVTETGNNAVNVTPPGSVQLPTQAVGSTSGVATLTFTFDSGGTIGAPAVLTMGASGLDFADAGTGSCTTNGSGHLYSPGDTCTVDITFTPKYPGMRKGAVDLVDTSAAVVATVLVYGIGTGPQAVFSPATRAVLPEASPGYNHFGIAVDGAGNVYLSYLVYSPKGIPGGYVYEIPAGCASPSCTVRVAGGSPSGIALDGAGNLYIEYEGFLGFFPARIEEMPAGCRSYTCMIPLGGDFAFDAAAGLAVDKSGSIYVADGQNVWKMPAGCTDSSCVTPMGGGYFDNSVGVAVDGNGTVYVATVYGGLAEMPSNCADQSCVHTPLSGVIGTDNISAVAVDGPGNIYVGDPFTRTVKEIPVGCALSSCVVTVRGPLGGYPQALAVDDIGSVYVGVLSQLLKLYRAAPAGLSFPTPTPAGTFDSADNPQAVTVQNIGNDVLTFPLPAAGTNPSVSTNFTWDDAASTCAQTDAGSASAFTLAAGATCSIAIDFAPTAAGSINGAAIMTYDNLYVPGNATQTILLSGQGIKGTAEVSAWPTASAITYGQTLASSTLTGGTASVPGSFAWTVPSIVPHAGSQSRSVTFTPTDSTSYNTVTGYVTITVNKAAPTVSAWPAATAITFGQTLASSTLTGGTASVPGTFAWTVPTILPHIGSQSRSVTFTPTDSTNYNTVTGYVTITVIKGTPTVSTWPTASTITFGQTLASSTLTGGAASIAGTFAWTTPSTAPHAGSQSESVTFTPTDTTDNNTVIGTVTVTVNKAAPTVSAWPTASAITFGQTLASSTLTGGTASIPGTFAWTTPSTAPHAGLQSESATFTPADSADYNTVASSLTLTVNQAASVIAWAAPAPIAYGTPLSATQLNATANVPGTLAYNPPAGTVLHGGVQALNVTFTPNDAADYATATDSVTLTVNPIAPAIALTSSANPSIVAQSVTFTAAVSSPAGTPTGSVTFWDGATQLSSGILAAGSATYATSTLAAGSHSITAQYSGDGNFGSVTSTALTQTVSALSIGPAPGAPTTANITPGGVANFVLSVTPPGNSPVNLSVSGLPTGATSSFSPNPVAAGAGPTNVQFVINLAGQASSTSPQHTPLTRMPLALGLLLLPFLGLRRSRRRAGRFLLLAILAIAGAAVAAGLSGCAGHNFNNGPTPSPTPEGAYPLTVTATAGATTQTTALTLNVQ